MNWKELKRRLDPKANYIWVKDTLDTWRLVNSFTLKTVCGCENRYSAEKMTRMLRDRQYSVEDLPRPYEEAV